MHQIAVLGDADSVLGFGALGFDVFPAETPQQARPILLRLVHEQYAVVYLTEQLAAGLTAELARCQAQSATAVILIPGKGGSLGIGMAGITTTVERAVGSDIL